jgi:flavodoxin
MTTACVVYRSATGTTRRLAESMAALLRERGLEVTLASVGEADPAQVAGADVVLLGCWTSGYLVVAQHPDQPWVDFVRGLPPLRGRVGLFTTYKLATGSMFPRMRAALAGKADTIGVELRSRDGRLGPAHRLAIDGFLRAAG